MIIKKSYLWSIVIGGTMLAAVKSSEKDHKMASEANILLFSSTGGGGHQSAAEALTGQLAPFGKVKVVQAFDTVLGCRNQEQFYNTLLRSGSGSHVVNSFAYMGRLLFSGCSCLIDKKFYNYFKSLLLSNEKMPTLIISVVPLINGVLARIAQTYNIPLMIIAVDLDIQNYMAGITQLPDNCKICLPATSPIMSSLIERARGSGFSNNQIVLNAFPVREQYHTHYDKQIMRKQYFGESSLPSFVIMILGGAAGSQQAYRILEHILQGPLTDRPVHIIMCCGNNERLAKQISCLHVIHPRVTIIIQKFTPNLAPLMAASDILITKPGPTSIHEAIALRTPVVVDSTTSPLAWEKANIELVRSSNIGYVLTHMEKLPALLCTFMKNKNLLLACKRRMQRLNKAINKVSGNILDLTQKMCSK